MPDPEPSFEAYMDDALSDVVVAPEPAPPPAIIEPAAPAVPAPAEPAAPTAPVTEPPVPTEEPGLSDKLTKMLAGEPPAEAPPAPDADDTPPPNATPAAQTKWAQMRQDVKWRKEHEPKLTQLQKDYDELKSKPPGPDPIAEKTRADELADLRTRAESYLKELQVSRVEATPEFRENILRPMDGLLERGKALAKKYSLEERDVVHALSETDDSARGDLLAGLASTFSEPDRMSLYRMGDQLGDYRSQAEFVKSNAKVALEALQKTEAVAFEQRKVKAVADWTQAIETVESTYRANLPLLKTIEGDDDWNKGTTDIAALVRNTKLYELPPVELAKILYQAATFPRALNVNEKLATEVIALRKRLAKFSAATPDAGGGSSTAGADLTPDPNLGFLEAVER